MGHFLQDLEDLLPTHLHEVLEWDFIPWDQLKDRHADLSRPALTALFDAYFRLSQHFDLKKLAGQTLPEDSWGCMRCGFCCSSMRPSPVKEATFKSWEEAGAPVAWFYRARGRKERNSVYRCWYNNGVLLRMCPFLFINRNDSRSFCLIYHMGEDKRPPVCSGFIPRHETCTSKQTPVEPWENV